MEFAKNNGGVEPLLALGHEFHLGRMLPRVLWQ
jgi:hypothetical protein